VRPERLLSLFRDGFTAEMDLVHQPVVTIFQSMKVGRSLSARRCSDQNHEGSKNIGLASEAALQGLCPS
jgi:hypothetical protein